MLIEKVVLKNIKLYKDKTFNFYKGINVLSGPNGSGKSTVFEAIGYALFGVDAKDFIGNEKRLVRKGEKNGSVVIHFSTDDSSHYVIERKIVSKSWKLFRVLSDGKKLAVEVKNDVELESELKKILGLKSDQPLKKQFLDIIGPLQSDFLGPFIKRGVPRQDEFDKTLGISAWRDVFDQSIGLRNEAQRQVEKRTEMIARKTAEVATYDLVVEDLRARQQQLVEKRGEMEGAAADLAAITQTVADMDRAKTEIERLQNERATQDAQANRLRAQKESAEAHWQHARSAKERCDVLEPGYRTYVEAEKALQPLRAQEKVAAQLGQELAKRKTDIAVLQNSIDTRKQSLAEKYKRAEAIRTEAAAEQIKLQARLDAAELEVRRVSEIAEAYEAFQLKGQRLSNRPKAIREEADRGVKDAVPIAEKLTERERRLQKKPELEAQARQEGDLQKAYESALQDLSALAARKQQLEEGNAKLAGGTCPFFEESCLNLEKKGSAPENFFGRRIQDLDQAAVAAGEQKRALEARLNAVRQAQKDLSQLVEVEREYARDRNRLINVRENLNKVLQPLISGAFLRELSEWIQEAPAASHQEELLPLLDARAVAIDTTLEAAVLIQSVINACAPLEAMASRMQDILTQRKRALDQQRRAAGESLARVQEQMRNLGKTKTDAEREIEGLEQEKEQWLQDRDHLNRQKAACEAQEAMIPPYDALAEKIQEQDALRLAHLEAYKEYLGRRAAAGEVAVRQEALAKLETQIAAAAAVAADLQARLDARASGYQFEAHEAARQRQTRLTGETARLKAEVERLDADVQRLQAEKGRMDAIRLEIKTLESEAKQYRKTLRFIEDMRDKVFRKVSEQLSERFREEISQLADRIYRIIARTDEELHWGTSYAIELVDLQDGTERRRYDEELSGGQVMSAVVALRLALLRTYGAKIGFFDEPTSNLDEQRRAQLALAFRSLDEGKGEVGSPWYDQLFLISHDVAFTEITDQIIHLGDEA